MDSCQLPLKFPACLDAVTALATIVYVYKPTAVCFDPGVVNCTLPAGLEKFPGVFPVNVTKDRGTFTQSSTTGEVWINTTGIQIPFNATTVYLGRGATGANLGTVRNPETKVIGVEDGVWLDKLNLAAAGIELNNFRITNLTIENMRPVEGLTLTAIDNVEPLRLTASPENGTINLEGVVLDANVVVSLLPLGLGLGRAGPRFFLAEFAFSRPQAILRHTGAVTCTGKTFCVVMDSVARKTSGGTVTREESAVVANINALTAVFGADYTVEFVDDPDVLNGAYAAQLASDLSLWTVVAALSILLAHGNKIFERRTTVVYDDDDD
jgi:hypothetical protein